MTHRVPVFVRWLLALVVPALLAGAVQAQSADPVVFGPVSAAVEAGLDVQRDLTGGLATGAAPLAEGRLSTAVEIAVLLTVLSLLPAILITVTSFTRIVIVMSFVRRALSTNELPPNPVIIGLSLFLTTFVMAPVAERVYEKAWVPYRAGQMAIDAAGQNAWGELRTFLVANTRESELELFADLAKLDDTARTVEELPLRVVVPAFVTSELKTSFQMGFLLFLPFLVIDLVVASVLLSMGMFMLPPVMVSTPFKILLFVLVDGWHLLCESLVTSFVTT
ncbi:MAG: flagellar type III secretion system pore protein FliP [Planctomycetes bacterium]|nr:flagellar type III secretion system pore protein FliP [Planctomycetota bacterium]